VVTITTQPCPVCGNPDGCPTCTHGSRCGEPDCPVCNPVRRRLGEIRSELNSIEMKMNAEGGLLTSDPRWLRLQSLWREENELEDVILDAFGWR